MNEISKTKAFDGWIVKYSHQSDVVGCSMKFNVFLPADCESKKDVAVGLQFSVSHRRSNPLPLPMFPSFLCTRISPCSFSAALRVPKTTSCRRRVLSGKLQIWDWC